MQFVVFKLNYFFVETMEFAKQVSFARPPVLPLIKPSDIGKEFQ